MSVQDGDAALTKDRKVASVGREGQVKARHLEAGGHKGA